MRTSLLLGSVILGAAALSGLGCGGDDASGSGGSSAASTTVTTTATTTTADTTTTTGTAGGGGSTGTGGAGAGGGPSDVTGTLADTHVTEGGLVSHVGDTSGVTVAALVPGAAGGFSTIPGTVADDGTFTIPAVPAGEYYLSYTALGAPTWFIVTGERTIDLGHLYAGRPDAAPITSPTPLSLHVDGLKPWQDGMDDMELFSLGAVALADLSYLVDPPIAGGTTDLNGEAVDAAQFLNAFAIEPDKGDRATVTQLVGHTSAAGVTYRSVEKALAVPPAFSLKNGQPASLTGSLGDLSKTPYSFAWKNTDFDALASAVHPSATVLAHSMTVYAEPGETQITRSFSPNLVVVDDPGSADVEIAFGFGNPFPGTWTSLMSVITFYKVPYAVPGDPKAHHVTPTVDFVVPIEDISHAAILPKMTPVTGLEVNGQPAYDALSGVGTAPTVHWTKPVGSTPKTYTVSVRVFDPALTAPQLVAALVTADTTVTLPPGLLTEGSYYVLVITARNGLDLAAPMKLDTTAAAAAALTGLLSP